MRYFENYCSKEGTVTLPHPVHRYVCIEIAKENSNYYYTKFTKKTCLRFYEHPIMSRKFMIRFTEYGVLLTLNFYKHYYRGSPTTIQVPQHGRGWRWRYQLKVRTSSLSSKFMLFFCLVLFFPFFKIWSEYI